jgi:hypothetical protein
MLEEVNKIFAILQRTNPLEEKSVPILLANQSKLSALLGNIGVMGAHARYQSDMKELEAKNFEADRFLVHKLNGFTDAKARYASKLDAEKKLKEAITAKHYYNEINNVLSAMEKMIMSCQVSLKHKEYDRSSSNYHTN